MAYRLKQIVHHETQCHIVLQNENGPCPLIAAANALILRGAITLNARNLDGNVVSIEDLISTLANWALSRIDSSTFDPSVETSIAETNIEADSEEHTGDHIHHLHQHHQLHIHEVMEMLPKLQFGLDINPKFTSGPDSFEYTSGLAIFDALGVDLVHGWISDPQDDVTYKTLQGKSYNQLTDLVIKGREASEEIRTILMTIDHKAADLLGSNQSVEIVEKNIFSNADCVEISAMDINETSSSNQTDLKDTFTNLLTSNLLPSGSREEADRDKNLNFKENCSENSAVSLRKSTEDKDFLLEELSCLQKELKRNQDIETVGHIISNFLNESSHQLTFFGLEKIHEYISDGQFCVFFRNNHFSTLTKHDGHLFLLVTDLGYANVNEVVWEKLDDINGNTDYADCEFKKPRPRSTMTPSVPLLPPETVLTQQRQQDRDLQLAIQLSEGAALNHEALDEEEAALLEAAKELSLHGCNQQSTDDWNNMKPKTVSTRTVTNVNDSPIDDQQQQESLDYKLALQLQQEQQDFFPSHLVISDEALARQLEAEERVAAASARRNAKPTHSNNNNVTRKSENKSNCTVS